MQKTTIFFIGTTVIVLMITGTVLGVNFAIRHSNENGVIVENPIAAAEIDEPGIPEFEEVVEEPNPGTEKNETTEISDEILEDKEEEKISDEILEDKEEEEISNEILEDKEEEEISNEILGETDTAIIVPTSIDSVEPSITILQVHEAGFRKATFPIIPFDGMVFNGIDMRNYVNESNLEYQIIENGETSAFLTEFNLLNPGIAQEVYEILRGKVEAQNEFTINETNQYGNASFFANNSTQTNHVFLVVKQGTRLYTCHYPAKNHNKIKNLITSI